jgi:hypothetical protein
VPAGHKRDHEPVHLKVSGITVVQGRLVAKGEVDVVVDGVTQGEPDGKVAERIPLNAVDGRFAVVIPNAVQ